MTHASTTRFDAATFRQMPLIHSCAITLPRVSASFFRLLRCLALAAASLVVLPAGAAGNGGPAETEDARRIFDDVRGRIYQIRSVTVDGDAVSSTGSGFLVGEGGLIATNWHVVDDHVLEPDAYRLEARRSDNARIPVRVVAIDAMNDLALLRADGEAGAPLRIRTAPLAKGEKGFAIGDPNRVGLTVVEGTFNGIAAQSLAGHYHFTGAVNPGMSGGPALTREGEVFGVTVAKRSDADLMGFLIPAERLAALVARAPAAAPDAAALLEEARQGMVRAQDAVARYLIEEHAERRQLGGFRFAVAPEANSSCQGSSAKEVDDGYKHESVGCYTGFAVSAGSRYSVATTWMEFEVVRNLSLDAFRFANRVAERAESNKDDKGNKKIQGRYSCSTSLVLLRGGNARATLCTRPYVRLAGLKDAHLRLATVDSSSEALIGDLVLRGFTDANIRRLVARYLESVEWKR